MPEITKSIYNASVTKCIQLEKEATVRHQLFSNLVLITLGGIRGGNVQPQLMDHRGAEPQALQAQGDTDTGSQPVLRAPDEKHHIPSTH